MQRGCVPETCRQQIALERHRVVSHDRSERPRCGERGSHEQSDRIHREEHAMRSERRPGARRPADRPLRREGQLVAEESEREHDSKEEELRARDKGEQQSRQREDVAPAARLRDRALAEKDGPDESGIGRVFGQQRRAHHEPRSEGRQQRRDRRRRA